MNCILETIICFDMYNTGREISLPSQIRRLFYYVVIKRIHFVVLVSGLDPNDFTHIIQ